MKRRLLWLLPALLLLLSACSGRTEQTQANNEREDPSMDRIISETTAIRMRDQAEKQFAEPLDLTLTEEETAALCRAMGELKQKAGPYGGYVMYVLDFLDRDGKLLGSLLVDNDVTLELSDGTAYRREGETDKALTAVEKRCGIREGLYTRRPGEDYFSLFSEVDHGYLYEITENNFVKGVNLDLGREDIDALRAALSGAAHSEQRLPSVPAKFIVELYTRGGGLVYRFTFDAEGRVYGLEYYELLNTGLTEWLDARR